MDPLLCSETPNVMHMQNYLCYNKIPNESKEQPSAKIMSTYQVSYNYELFSGCNSSSLFYIILIHINTLICYIVIGMYYVSTSIKCCTECLATSRVVERYAECANYIFRERTQRQITSSWRDSSWHSTVYRVRNWSIT